MNKPLTRRHFLALSGAAAAAAPRAMATRTAAGDTVHVGIIGMGQRGLELAKELRQRACRISAVADTTALHRDRGRAVTGANACSSWEDLLQRNDIDAVVIATPDHLHAPMTLAAIEAGKDVYCETPMSRAVDEAIAVKSAAAATGRSVQIGAQGVMDGGWRSARTLIRDGALGELYWCQSSCPVAANPDPQSWRTRWDTSGGIASGAVFDRLASMMTSLGLAIPDRVSAAGGRYAGDHREVPDSFVITLEYGGGPNLVLTSANAHRNGSPTVVRGRHGTLHLDGATACIEARSESGLRVLPSSPQQDGLLDDWLQSIRSGTPCAFGPDRAYPVMVAAAMANEAYRRGLSVTFDAESSQVIAGPQRGGRIV